MQLVFVVFDGMTTLDMLGAYDAVRRLRELEIVPTLRCRLFGRRPSVRGHDGVRIEEVEEGSLSGHDVVVVPGGLGTRALTEDAEFVQWLAGAAGTPLLASVCTGSLLLGAAGLLAGRPATTHPTARELLARYTRRVSDARIVDCGSLVTAAGVTSSIDLGLHLCERLAGPQARVRVAAQMDYPYFDPNIVERSGGDG